MATRLDAAPWRPVSTRIPVARGLGRMPEAFEVQIIGSVIPGVEQESGLDSPGVSRHPATATRPQAPHDGEPVRPSDRRAPGSRPVTGWPAAPGGERFGGLAHRTGRQARASSDARPDRP